MLDSMELVIERRQEGEVALKWWAFLSLSVYTPSVPKLILFTVHMSHFLVLATVSLTEVISSHDKG